MDYDQLYKRLAQEIVSADGKLADGAQAFALRLAEKLKAEGYQLQGDAEQVLADYLGGIDGTIKTSIARAVVVGSAKPLTAASLQSPAVMAAAEQAFVAKWPDGLNLSTRLWHWRTDTQAAVSDVLKAGVRQGHATGKVLYAMQREIERTAGDRFAIVSAHKADWVHKLADAGRELINEPFDRAEWDKVVADTEAYINGLAVTGTRHDAQRLLSQIKTAVDNGRYAAIDRAVHWKIYDKQLYNLKRISRTEMADAGHNAVINTTESDPTIIGYQWRVSSSHKVPDICDYYANIDMGLGKGIFTKDAVPRHKAHPHCMCLLVPRVTPIKQPGSHNYADFIGKVTPEQRGQLLPKWAQQAMADGTPLEKLVRTDGAGLLSKQEAIGLGHYKPKLTLDEIYAKAAEAKPGFDSELERLAKESGGIAQLTPIKDKARALAKINALYDGDASQIRDVLRGSIIVNNAKEVDKAFQLVKDSFPVAGRMRNGYATAVNSSDGYFDAMLEVRTHGIVAEVQIHTQAMVAAKESVHGLYEQRQAITRSAGNKLSAEQRKEVSAINKQMREIYRKASEQ
ncbi:hypothetical protein [Methylovulum psychrotolerans]|uniref:RelA/SpoT domain-containing protein n=1 Tax=Methylovulum psychrotolerans TaxID=1704499 RepID=A0A1Z4C0F3_9GAMM|nr:hypothetical protein [Methylovulum psychrotolerans]ASF47005.1 hypothetical protein CEK71_13505 [Methylovulum psychrotolerans]